MPPRNNTSVSLISIKRAFAPSSTKGALRAEDTDMNQLSRRCGSSSPTWSGFSRFNRNRSEGSISKTTNSRRPWTRWTNGNPIPLPKWPAWTGYFVVSNVCKAFPVTTNRNPAGNLSERQARLVESRRVWARPSAPGRVALRQGDSRLRGVWLTLARQGTAGDRQPPGFGGRHPRLRGDIRGAATRSPVQSWCGHCWRAAAWLGVTLVGRVWSRQGRWPRDSRACALHGRGGGSELSQPVMGKASRGLCGSRISRSESSGRSVLYSRRRVCACPLGFPQ
ncbi:hypothetical protein SAMN04487905_101280 [Actinopolyspora xinjiangensis]|uniref:Uncharacterized protein n=1 Tax=Actinopolyspora xinjiangensis TaxID=405564 RepID=A0A1H0NWJ7_9ACTN|nr:hypothetical protein SAMN04487905_101280 [Actinopolyspora xinjiangensis]